MSRQKKENRTTIRARVNIDALTKAIEIFRALGYPYGDGAAYGEVIEAIASGELELSKKKVDKPIDNQTEAQLS